jgi:hypothetical protein
MKRVALALCCLVLTTVLGCRHDRDSFYPNRSDAEKNGEFDRGWLPNFLPNSSHAIHLAYDLSPSREWCRFEFNRQDEETLLSGLKSANSPSLRVAHIPSPQLQWWPKVLEANLNLQAIQRAGFEVYSVTRSISQEHNETLVFAINRKEGRGYFYGE